MNKICTICGHNNPNYIEISIQIGIDPKQKLYICEQCWYADNTGNFILKNYLKDSDDDCRKRRDKISDIAYSKTTGHGYIITDLANIKEVK